MQVNESDLDSSQRSRMEQIWNWRGWSWGLSLIFFSDNPTVVFRCKSSNTQMPTLTKCFFFKDCREREVAKKDLLQFGVHPSVHMAEVFSNPGKARFCPQIWFHHWYSVGSANRMGLEWSCPTCKNVVTFTTRKANFDCWKLEWTWCEEDTRVVDDRHILLASFSRSFFCASTLLQFALECRVFFAMTSVVVSRVDWWRTFLTNCEERHNNLSKLNCWTHIVVAMIRGLRQALTRIGCLLVLEFGLTGEEPCLAEMTDYDHVYHDNVTGASLPCKMCEEAMQLEIKW